MWVVGRWFDNGSHTHSEVCSNVGVYEADSCREVVVGRAFDHASGGEALFLLLRVQHGGEYISTMFGCV